MAKKTKEKAYTVPGKALDLSDELKPPARPEDKDADLLKEIRSDFTHFKDYWRENREEMETNMRFAGGDAFSPEDRKFRGDRPCETPDELSQYVKQANNNLRQNKRDCTISPSSEDATGEDAEKREAVLRGLNHRGDFQACFQTAFEGCTWSGFGFFGVGIKKNKDGHLEPYPRRFPNQFAVLLDPYAKKADYSDQKKCFVIDVMRKSDFAAEYPDAKQKSFSADDSRMAPDWVMADELVIAEAWRVEKDMVWQYITNGLEILEKIKWQGSWIPLIPILGEEIYVTEEGRQKRKYLSLIHRARTPQKMLAFAASQELEELGMAPRTPLMLWEGQEQADPDHLANLNTSPYPFVKLKPIYGDNGELLPPPMRHPFIPNAQVYEMVKESWRRGIQSGVGVMPMPTAAQRQNEKSGLALEKIQNQEATGSYHFTDNADRALVNYGRQMNELIHKGMTADRHVGVKNQDDSHGLMYLATKDKPAPMGMDPKNVLMVDKGDFDVTITPGPSKESQREDASDFVDTLLTNMKALPIPPPIAIKIIAMAVRLKNVGHLGDEIADLLDPKEGDPQQQAMNAMQKLQAQGQQMQEMQGELQKLQQEKAGHVVDNEYKIKLKQMDHALEMAKLDNARAIAEISTKAQIVSERQQQIHEVELELHGSAHDSAMAAQNAVHGQQSADQQHANALEQGQQSGDQQSQLADQNAANAQAAAEAQPESGQ